MEWTRSMNEKGKNKERRKRKEECGCLCPAARLKRKQQRGLADGEGSLRAELPCPSPGLQRREDRLGHVVTDECWVIEF